MAEEEKKSAPVWMYRGDDSRLFNHPDEVPDGWSDTPGKPAPKPKRKAKEQPEPTKEEVNDDGS